jgi:hypothetical protein
MFLMMGCGDLFFPKTGLPTVTTSRRSTPQGVINQLVEAYETQRIELIEEILADSFQFYVAPSFESFYSLEYNAESPDTSLQYIVSKPYFYWKRKDELYRTKKIFEHTVSAQFLDAPHIFRIRYEISKDNDTNGVELQLDGGTLYLATSGQEYQLVDINNQVFLLRRDKEGLWVIRKWYDLSTEKSTI